jgi:hypothetical protein
MLQDSVQAAAVKQGVSRRDFLKFCSMMAGILAMPRSYAARIERALATPARLPVIWLEMQDCAGCTEALLRATQPTVAQLVLDVLSVDYHETIMAASGNLAEEAKQATIKAGGTCWSRVDPGRRGILLHQRKSACNNSTSGRERGGGGGGGELRHIRRMADRQPQPDQRKLRDRTGQGQAGDEPARLPLQPGQFDRRSGALPDLRRAACDG